MSLDMLEKRLWAIAKQVGRFFGEVDGSTMASLIKMGMFKKVSLFDYQAMCKVGHHHGNSARPLLSPFYAVAAILRWILSNALMFLLEFNFCGLWHSDYFVDGHKTKKVDALQPCDTAYPGYMYDSMFVVQQIPDSNLILVVAQADCDCSRQYGPIPLEPKEIKYIL
ncbi:Voltage-dependent calcium channel subunit alpha-2/delta-3 [Dissostichus eleginoides]|uniref:Voltage-dependent calcium channel subunit alpha-2/delta-3 n=1 Tax=Dissostichus eleginoides TaxID=100907 RepID=A0AAD9F4F4_DISEL|nr:Voltage-dependent calcium channel subunit alpha-2/delta-3 [Dissostichus eleginoides]